MAMSHQQEIQDENYARNRLKYQKDLEGLTAIPNAFIHEARRQFHALHKREGSGSRAPGSRRAGS